MLSRRLVLVLLGILLAVWIGLDFFAEHHANFWIEGTPGFAAWYGLLACLVAVLVAYGWGRLFQRPEARGDD